jgi:dienelactone hydrolase
MPTPIRCFIRRCLGLAGALSFSLVLLAGLVCRGEQIGREAGLRVGIFRCEVTPPLGHPLCGGWIKPLEAVDAPLLAKGLVLEQGRNRYVLCAVDWCLLETTAHELFRRKLAAAAEAPESHVAVHTVHQHNAPIADITAQQLLAPVTGAPRHLDLRFMDEVTERLAASVRAGRRAMRPVTHVGYGRARVEKFASNRRVRLDDGAIHVRYSKTTDASLQAAPEGLVDPWLRTVTLFAGTQPLVRLHYYATHPMSFYGDGLATPDTVGLARDQFEREEGLPQIYFSGCGGNLTAGKYNDGSPQARIQLTERIHTAMQRAVAATRTVAVHRLDWRTAQAALALRTEPEWSEPKARALLADTNATVAARLGAALTAAWVQWVKAHPKVELSCARLGPVTILNLPGEAFVEYQLYAQSLRPTDFIAVAAYGESGAGYICCDAALQEGGYEPTDARVGPPSEWRLKAAIARLIGIDRHAPRSPFYPDKLHLLHWRDRHGLEHPINQAADWPKRRAHILDAMSQVMGPNRPGRRPGPPEVHVLEQVPLAQGTRRKILFAAEPENRVPAYLFLPPASARKAPAMLCLHQTTPAGKAEPAGLAGRTNLHYARELAERGYVTLAPDYPNFGDYRRDAYAAGYASATLQGLVNHRRALDLLASMPEVDPRRIGVIGHSLGGHNALFLAAFDTRVQAVVTSCGFNSFFKYYGGDLTGWSHAGYMPRIRTAYGCDPKQMPFDFTEVLAAIAPRALFINAPLHDDNFELSGVKDCLAAAAPVYRLLRAANALQAVHPDAEHDFPPAARRAAYDWLDRQLRP